MNITDPLKVKACTRLSYSVHIIKTVERIYPDQLFFYHIPLNLKNSGSLFIVEFPLQPTFSHAFSRCLNHFLHEFDRQQNQHDVPRSALYYENTKRPLNEDH
ncbi:hypothetical protein Zmor_000368 [Zophobas morio]|uniref:Uncharacterized protein n=1 Tax=Zophobas morio TaxID=2755281 RepID=A0AA38IZ24_9CUCU|nr:hypothetical protein Zmor_000368 [Zophobas morio]